MTVCAATLSVRRFIALEKESLLEHLKVFSFSGDEFDVPKHGPGVINSFVSSWNGLVVEQLMLLAYFRTDTSNVLYLRHTMNTPIMAWNRQGPKPDDFAMTMHQSVWSDTEEGYENAYAKFKQLNKAILAEA